MARSAQLKKVDNEERETKPIASNQLKINERNPHNDLRKTSSQL